jgi:hypothetical protein
MLMHVVRAGRGWFGGRLAQSGRDVAFSGRDLLGRGNLKSVLEILSSRGLDSRLASSNACGTFVGLGCASLCFVMLGCG